MNFSEADSIELTEEEKAEALLVAKEAKLLYLRKKAYSEKLRAVKTYPRPSSETLLSEFRKQWAVDSDNQKIVNQLCYFFSADDRFEGNLEKGILISGGVGTGKSTIMQFFAKNMIGSYRLVGCRAVEVEFSSRGDDAVAKYSYMHQIAVNADSFGHQNIGFCFDDLGTESNSKHFGREKNIMAEIILNRYDNQVPFNSTHITTNLTAKDIIENYGVRFADRCREMFNMISFSPEIKSRRR